MRLIPLLLLLAACASPAEYQRGTFAPVPAPVRAPGVGAPVLGQPGMQPRTIPRGTDRRVLPPTREPGIWASDSAGRPALVVIFGQVIPLPYAEDARSTIEPANECRDRIHAEAANDPLLRQAVDALAVPERQCLSSLLFFACINTMSMLGRDDTDASTMDVLRNDATAYMEAVCPNGPTDKVRRLAERWLSNRKRSGP